MANTGFKEIRGKRSVTGKIMLFLFLAFNVLMVIWLIDALGNLGELVARPLTEAEEVGLGIGAGIGLTFLFFIWVLGDIILGIPVLITRPSKTLVPIENKEQ